MKKIGKIGKANQKANRLLKIMFESKGITYCELRLDGCLGTFALSFAHRHKRHWYRGQLEKLHDFQQVALSCIKCHEIIEKDSELTEKIFKELRGHE